MTVLRRLYCVLTGHDILLFIRVRPFGGGWSGLEWVRHEERCCRCGLVFFAEEEVVHMRMSAQEIHEREKRGGA